jgi:hypothetical protein
MNRNLMIFAVVLAVILGLQVTRAHAQQRGQTTMMHEGKPKEEALRDEKWGLTPQLGVIGYTNNTGSSTSRVTLGVGFDWNAESLIRPDAPKDQFLGISTGFTYAHPGANDANFFGSSSAAGGESNLFLIPIDLKLGTMVNDSVRFSVRGGGNLIYRSNASSTDLGAGSGSTSSLWKIYPNVGVDADIQLSKSILLTVRPDLTLTPGNDIYVATVGATFVGF